MSSSSTHTTTERWGKNTAQSGGKKTNEKNFLTSSHPSEWGKKKATNPSAKNYTKTVWSEIPDKPVISEPREDKKRKGEEVENSRKKCLKRLAISISGSPGDSSFCSCAVIPCETPTGGKTAQQAGVPPMWPLSANHTRLRLCSARPTHTQTRKHRHKLSQVMTLGVLEPNQQTIHQNDSLNRVMWFTKSQSRKPSTLHTSFSLTYSLSLLHTHGSSSNDPGSQINNWFIGMTHWIKSCEPVSLLLWHTKPQVTN